MLKANDLKKSLVFDSEKIVWATSEKKKLHNTISSKKKMSLISKPIAFEDAEISEKNYTANIRLFWK